MNFTLFTLSRPNLKQTLDVHIYLFPTTCAVMFSFSFFQFTIKLKCVQNRSWVILCCQHDSLLTIIAGSSNSPQADTWFVGMEQYELLSYSGVFFRCNPTNYNETPETFGKISKINSLYISQWFHTAKFAYY